jgi:hypothetical protein
MQFEFEFEPNLKHQSDAISAVVSIFEGASYIRPALLHGRGIM